MTWIRWWSTRAGWDAINAESISIVVADARFRLLAGSKERTCQYCQLMRLHVGIIRDRVSDILRGFERNGITLQALYDQSAFLAKYTDVVP